VDVVALRAPVLRARAPCSKMPARSWSTGAKMTNKRTPKSKDGRGKKPTAPKRKRRVNQRRTKPQKPARARKPGDQSGRLLVIPTKSEAALREILISGDDPRAEEFY
jgi:hypothetical protein